MFFSLSWDVGPHLSISSFSPGGTIRKPRCLSGFCNCGRNSTSRAFSSTDSHATPLPNNARVLRPQLAIKPCEPLGRLGVLRIFCNVESRTFAWCPVLEKGIGQLWILFPLQENVSEEDHQYMVSKWSRVLIVRDITTKAKPSSKYNPVTAELYHPNFVYRQFGLGQQIPLPCVSRKVLRAQKAI